MLEDREPMNIQPLAGADWPHPWDPGDHCYIHGCEPIWGEPYMICGECQHCYRTSEELLLYFWGLVRLANNDPDMDRPEDYPVKADDVLFCPLCLHDF